MPQLCFISPTVAITRKSGPDVVPDNGAFKTVNRGREREKVIRCPSFPVSFDSLVQPLDPSLVLSYRTRV
ncbi:hypothetical protein AVEN_9535-1 [Araneus ventricosus]|uniref:Uncharacterized protein n=1 Tax=Araneus ventricosus TaxID=182803 RepID=A0A4Y2PVI6_ARAVE|nr:hypothetical protein AVEN_9535-1 [Araneus ventricosus]